MKAKIKNFIGRIWEMEAEEIGEENAKRMMNTTIIIVFLVIYWTVVCEITKWVFTNCEL